MNGSITHFNRSNCCPRPPAPLSSIFLAGRLFKSDHSGPLEPTVVAHGHGSSSESSLGPDLEALAMDVEGWWRGGRVRCVVVSADSIEEWIWQPNMDFCCLQSLLWKLDLIWTLLLAFVARNCQRIYSHGGQIWTLLLVVIAIGGWTNSSHGSSLCRCRRRMDEQSLRPWVRLDLDKQQWSWTQAITEA